MIFAATGMRKGGVETETEVRDPQLKERREPSVWLMRGIQTLLADLLQYCSLRLD
jgi:hypothetical protein